MYTLTILAAVLGVVCSKDFILVNHHSTTIWVRTLGNAGLPAPGGGRIELAAGAQTTISVDSGWAGRFWGETGCNGAACDPGPNTLAEFNIGDLDFYDVSLVDGFNLPILVEPIGGSVDPNNPYHCGVAGCTNNLLPGCPNELRELNSAGQLVVCRSACAVYATDQYCCGGAYGTPDTCNPDTWAVDSASYFKANCPGAYSYAYDDQASTYTCPATSYRITYS